MPELGLVYWIKDYKTGLVPVESILEENRRPGQVGPVKWTDGISYPAQVIKISKCVLTLEKAEEAFMKKMEALKAKEEEASLESGDQSKGRSRNRASKKATAEVSGSASDVQIAKALGEKIKLNPKLSAEMEAQKKKEKEAKTEADKTERELDEVILHSKQNIVGSGIAADAVRRNLNVLLSSGGPPAKKARSVSPAPVGIQSLLGNESDDAPSEAIESAIVTTHGSDESEEEDENEPCNRCRSLSIAVRHGTVAEFVASLTKFCNLPPETVPEVKIEVSGDEVLRYLKPLPITPGHKKVELTIGSGLFIKKAKKSQLIVDGGNDPHKLTRITLIALYGEQLKAKGISAKARGAERLGIEEADLTNIYNFVCRNSNVQQLTNCDKGKQKPPFNFSSFIREVNKKFKSCSRDRKQKQTCVGTKPVASGAGKKTDSTQAQGPKPEASVAGKKTESSQAQGVKEVIASAHVGGSTLSKVPDKSGGKNSPSGSSRLSCASTPKKNWEVTALNDMGRQHAFYEQPQSWTAPPRSYGGFESWHGYGGTAHSNYHGYTATQYGYPDTSGPSGSGYPVHPYVQSSAPEESVMKLLDTNTLLSL